MMIGLSSHAGPMDRRREKEKAGRAAGTEGVPIDGLEGREMERVSSSTQAGLGTTGLDRS